MVKIAIVGAGGIAQRHISALKSIPYAAIVGIIDVNTLRAQTAALSCGAKAYTSLEECIDKADVVYILTPPSTHKEISIRSMSAGKHVVCEKPLAITVEDAAAMVTAAKQNNVKLITAFNMRFRKGFSRLKEIVESGKLGNIINFWSQRVGMGVGTGYNWRTDPGLLCGMSIESLSHDIDLIRWIAGDVLDVRANILESRSDLPGFDNNANVALTLSSGATAMIHASWSSHLAMNSRGVIGTKGTAFVSGPGLWDVTKFHWKTENMECEYIELLNDPFDVTPFLEENKYYISCIENNTHSLVTGEDGLAALKVSHAILTSHKEKRVVTL